MGKWNNLNCEQPTFFVCNYGEEITANTGCDVFDIDGFLTECSAEFPAAKSEIDEVHGSMMGMIADLEKAQNATSDAVDVLSAKVETEVARVDGESDATNAAISSLGT